MATLQISLSSRKYPGLFALIDEEDYERVSAHKWHPLIGKHHIYAYTALGYGRENKKLVLMHRFLLNPPEGVLIDHKDRNGLNNTRNNLRHATKGENNRNSVARTSNGTGFKGVTYLPKRKKYLAQIRMGTVNRFLGHCNTAEEAARLYDAAAIQLHGKFARPNFPAT